MCLMESVAHGAQLRHSSSIGGMIVDKDNIASGEAGLLYHLENAGDDASVFCVINAVG